MGTPETRQNKIEWMGNYLNAFFSKRPKETIDRDKLLAEFAIQHSSSVKTGSEILRMLSLTQKIKIENNLISRR